MNSVISFLERQYGNVNTNSYDSILTRLCVHARDNYRGISPSHYASDFNPEPPIFSAKFATSLNNQHVLAIANEDGKIALQDTNNSTDLGKYEVGAPLEGYQCHFNAVFDLEWVPQQNKIVSASGDHTARLWDVRESQLYPVQTFKGHSRSVKTVAFRKDDPNAFATGGRDGAILIWDMRDVNTHRADNCIYSGHGGTGPTTPQSHGRRRARNPKIAPNTVSSSITGLVFPDEHTLVSCGGGDGVIKMWDLRRNYSCYKKEPLPKHSFPYAGNLALKGYSNLLVNQTGTLLYANCMDSTIYCYNLMSCSSVPVERYTGLRNETFYIKSCLSPDDQYLMSGSTGDKAYIWNIRNPQPLVALDGHSLEVTCVAWSSAKDVRMVTCSDDLRHKIWRFGPETIEKEDEMWYRGKAELINDYKHHVKLKAMDNTPRRIRKLRMHNEKTPGSTEKNVQKRSFSTMMEDNQSCNNEVQNDTKRPHLEARARRLFSPVASGSNARLFAELNGGIHLTPICEDPEPQPSSSGMGRSNMYHSNHLTDSSNLKSPEFTASRALTFSPTLNLPNYVVDGEAPHLHLVSPKRKCKENVDWLTKIRKQKLSTSITQLLHKSEKVHEMSNGLDKGTCSSPRLLSLRSEHSPSVPKRRISRSGSIGDGPLSPRVASSTPNPEITLLRFFSVVQSTKRELTGDSPR